MTFTKEELTERLKQDVLTITFKKVNSEEIRVMPCTLRPDLIQETTSKGTKKKNDSVLSVWCTDKDAWRSFRIENVISVEKPE